MPSLYRPILKRAFSIAWRKRILWIFGFFTALAGSNGEYNYIISQINKLSEQNTLANKIIALFNAGIIKNFFAALASNPLYMIPVSIMTIILVALAVIIVASSQIALIKGAEQTERGEPIRFKTIIAETRKYFWPFISLNLIFQAIIIILTFLASINILIFVLSGDILVALPLTVFLMIVLLAFIALAIFILQFASRYLLIKNQPVVPAIKNGILLFKNNWLIGLEYGLILFVISLLIGGILASLSFYAFGLPFTVTLVVTKEALFQNLLSLALIIILLVSALVGSILSIFCYSGWTLLFLCLTNDPIRYQSKLARIALWFKNRSQKIKL